MGAQPISATNFEATVSKGVALLDFWAPWCGPCRMLGPVIDELATEYAGKAAIGKVNVDDESELAQRYGIRSIPAVFVLKDGAVVEQFVGVRTKAVLAEALNKALKA
jgi:thioredoxin 1